MRGTKKITISAAVVALSALFLALGAFVDVLDLSACALASVLVVFVYIEIGSPYTYLVWLCTSLIAFLFTSGNPLIAAEYFTVFGIFPILKAYIEKLPKALWLVLKLVYINIVLVCALLFFELLFGVPFFDTEGISFFGLDMRIIKMGLYLLLNVTFVLYDMLLTVLIRVYLFGFRSRISRFLK